MLILCLVLDLGYIKGIFTLVMNFPVNVASDKRYRFRSVWIQLKLKPVHKSTTYSNRSNKVPVVVIIPWDDETAVISVVKVHSHDAITTATKLLIVWTLTDVSMQPIDRWSCCHCYSTWILPQRTMGPITCRNRCDSRCRTVWTGLKLCLCYVSPCITYKR